MADPIVLPEPIGPQCAALDHPASRKVWRWGRRTGKTRGALVAAVAGHGPGADGHKLHAGILGGGDVVWIAQDYPNLLRVAWKEEVRPRFAHLPYARLNEQAHTLTLDGLGTLHFVSAEAIDGIRGMGSRVIGVIVDEAAWLDLERALLDVILPILLDNGGWLILLSTTNAGADGNQAKRLPSYFNGLCAQIRAGQRGPEWAESHATAFDNPVIDNAALHELIAEYPEGSPRLKQEVYAELLQAGEGLALPSLHKDVHLVDPFDVPLSCERVGMFDWGFNHPWAYGDLAWMPDGNAVLVDTLWGRGDQVEAIADQIIAGTRVPQERVRAVWAGPDIFGQMGKAIGYKGPTRAEKLLLAGIKVVRANNDRVTGLDNLRSYLQYTADEAGTVTHPPRLTMMRTEGNLRLFAQLAQMQIDPKNPEDALKVDADYAGRGGDDGYDCIRYGLMSRPIRSKNIQVVSVPENVSPGYDWKKRQPGERQSGEQYMQQIYERNHGPVTANRNHIPRR